jgi:hypothetical protein
MESCDEITNILELVRRGAGILGNRCQVQSAQSTSVVGQNKWAKGDVHLLM